MNLEEFLNKKMDKDTFDIIVNDVEENKQIDSNYNKYEVLEVEYRKVACIKVK